MGESERRVDEVRRERSELENHVIDEYAAGRISRREFVRRGTVIGMSIPLVSWLAAACGGEEEEAAAPPADTSAPAAPPATATEPAAPPPAAAGGGTFTFGLQVPSAGLDPVLVADAGGLNLNGQTGQYLSLSLGQPELTPVLAESWEPNTDASVWTFTIRQGVTFNDEANTPMTTADVAATFNRLADPANKSNALSVFPGVFSAGGATAPDESTVVFELDGPNGSWPWLVSSDNYNAIILPENYAGDWEQTWVGTGPWKLESYTPAVGAALVRNTPTGASRPSRTGRDHLLRRSGGGGPPPPGRAGRRARRDQRGRTAGRSSRTPPTSRSSTSGPRRTASFPCARIRSLSPTSACARRSRSPSTAGDPRRPLPGTRRHRQRQSVRAGVRLHEHRHPAAREEHRDGKAAHD